MKDANAEQPTLRPQAPPDVAACLDEMRQLTMRLEHALETFQAGLDMLSRLLEGFADHFRPDT